MTPETAEVEHDDTDLASDDEWFELVHDAPDPDSINRAILGYAYSQRGEAECEAATSGEMARLDERYERAKREILSRHEQAMAPLKAKTERYRQYLQGQMARMFHADDKRTSAVYTAGTLATRDPGVEFVYDDEDAALAWLQANRPDLVTTPEPKPRIAKTELRKAVKANTLTKDHGTTAPADEDGRVLTDDGTPIPGVRVQAKRREFTIDADRALRDGDLEPFGNGAF